MNKGEKKSFCELLVKSVIVLAVILIIWLIIANIFNSDSKLLILPLFLFVVFCYFLAKKNIVVIHNKRNIVFIVLISLSLVGRFSFMALEYAPTSDPNKFLAVATNLVTYGCLGNHAKYVAIYPFTFSYDVLLAGSMKLFGTSLLSVIILNTVFDTTTCILLYTLVKKSSKSTKTALSAVMLWVISPFNIIFSALSLPVIVVNTLLISSLLMLYLVLENIKKLKKLLLLSIAAGCVLALANMLRPFMVVFLIAVFIYMALIVLKDPSRTLYCNIAISLATIVIVFSLGGFGFKYIVSNVTGYPPTEGVGSWNFYVGSNYKTSGKWNQKDSDYFNYEVLANETDISAAYNRIKKEGIDRYKALTPLQLLNLAVKKSIVLGGTQSHSIYNLNSYPLLWSHSVVMSLLWFACGAYTLLLLVPTGIFLVKRFKESNHPDFYCLLALIFVGLFTASLLVEVASRYFMPFFALLTIFASCNQKNEHKLPI